VLCSGVGAGVWSAGALVAAGVVAAPVVVVEDDGVVAGLLVDKSFLWIRSVTSSVGYPIFMCIQ
jgi:hypothetical protein